MESVKKRREWLEDEINEERKKNGKKHSSIKMKLKPKGSNKVQLTQRVDIIIEA